MDDVRIRRVRAEEWREVKAFRLVALRDPAAAVAFLDTHDDAVARPDEFWQQGARNGAEGTAVGHFIAEDADGRWLATASGLREEPGGVDFEGRPIEHLQVHVVGVFVHPDQRGSGLFEGTLDAIADWAREHGIDRLRLHVNEHNPRARAVYARCGFRETGGGFDGVTGRELEMVRDA